MDQGRAAGGPAGVEPGLSGGHFGPVGRRRRDAAEAWRLRGHTARLVALDTRFGAGELLGPAVRAADAAGRAVLGVAASRERLAAVAEADQLAGWLAYDADRHALARRLTARAVRTARVAGDRSAEHFALSQLAMQAIHLRRPDVALRICDDVLRDELPPGVRTLFVMRRARAVNQYGEHAAARRLIAETYGRHLQGPGTRDPAWAWWLDAAEITWHHAMTHADNGDWTRAIPLFEQAAAGRIPGSRTAHNDHAYLLHAFAHTRAWSDAADLLTTRVLPAQRGVSSARITHLLADTARLLHVPGRRPAGRDLAHELRAGLSRSAPRSGGA
ncbi:hypothetical protein [Embleya sp. NPDC020630]|uniref:hypothetical protein n=1 Tax=Embleya sp. NPDC020630 TaxID=3363979 RepID=UPI003792C337